MDFDKHVARQYDRISDSKYLFIIAGQLLDGVITENDLSNLSKEVLHSIKMITNIQYQKSDPAFPGFT